MAVQTKWIQYEGQPGYLALPEHASGPLPAVVVIHDLLGLDDHVEDLARRIAAAGYAALAPDLFAAGGERPAALARERISEAMRFLSRQPPAALSDSAAREAALARLPEPERLRIGETIPKVLAFASPHRLQGLVEPLRSTVRYLRFQCPETRGQKVASLGEALSSMLACEERELAAAVVFYGATPQPAKLAQIHCPVLAFYGGKDTRINAGIPSFIEAMRVTGTPFEYHIYEGAGHGFFNDTKPGYYDVRASRDSFARLLLFLLETIAPQGNDAVEHSSRHSPNPAVEE